MSEDELYKLKVISTCCEAGAVLVGGQAIALWANAMGLLDDRHIGFVTIDIDFAATIEQMKVAKQNIEDTESITMRVADMMEESYMSGTFFWPKNLDLSVDFLCTVYGLTDKESRSHIEILIEGHRIKVLHPLYCLKSRILNIYGIPSKRSNIFAHRQLMLALFVLEKYWKRYIEEVADGEAEVRKEIEILIRMMRHRTFRAACKKTCTDVSRAIPLEAMQNAQFLSRRFPEIFRYVSKRLKVKSERVST